MSKNRTPLNFRNRFRLSAAILSQEMVANAPLKFGQDCFLLGEMQNACMFAHAA